MLVGLSREKVEAFKDCQVLVHKSGKIFLIQLFTARALKGLLDFHPAWTAQFYEGRESDGEPKPWVHVRKGWPTFNLRKFRVHKPVEDDVQFYLRSEQYDIRILKPGVWRVQDPDILKQNEKAQPLS